MSVQDKVERVLREFYVLYSRSEPYDKNVEPVSYTHLTLPTN